jgi:hypothetical protein
MVKVEVGQRWSNTTRHQIIEIISIDNDKCWYTIISDDGNNTIHDHKKNEKHINRLYTLIK